MSEKEWNKLVDLVEKIVGQGGSWQEKAKEVREAFEERGSTTVLEEFSAWFAE